MLIKLETEKQHFNYERELFPLDKFGIQTDILVTPLSLLCSQKIAAIMGRKRPKGRDFYDVHWILQRTTPNYAYLNDRFEVTEAEGLRQMVSDRIAPFNFAALGEDVELFLFDSEDVSTVRNFPAFWENVRIKLNHPPPSATGQGW